MTAGRSYPIWMLTLVPAGRFGRLWGTIGLLSAGALVYGIAAWLQSRNPAACSRDVPCLSWSIVLFFVCAVAYIVPAFHYVTSRTQRTLDALAPYVDDANVLGDARRAISRRPLGWYLRTTLPGLVIFSPLVALLLLLPVWPLHRELLRQRTSAIATAQAQVRARRDTVSNDGGGLAAALSLRREISRLPVWPFDVGAVTRFVSYAVIVPMTWAGAALIEMLVNLLLE